MESFIFNIFSEFCVQNGNENARLREKTSLNMNLKNLSPSYNVVLARRNTPEGQLNIHEKSPLCRESL